jgi:integrase
MGMINLKYLQSETNRHGKRVFYVRAERRGPRIRVACDDPESPAFAEAYAEAIRQLLARIETERAAENPNQIQHVPRPKRGTLGHAVQLYQAAGLSAVAPAGRIRHIRTLENLASAYPNQSPEAVTRRVLMEALAGMTPGKAEYMLKIFRRFWNWAVDAGLADTNPTTGLKRPRPANPAGFTPWTETDVQERRKAWKIGTMARFCLELALCTQLRRTDLAQVGWAHLKQGGTRIQYRPTKTAGSSGVSIDATVSPELAACLAAAEPTRGTELPFLRRRDGKPYANGNNLGNVWKDWQAAVDLEPINLHGVRKLVAEIISEEGGTVPDIMAALGHSTPDQAMHYAMKADRKRASDRASALVQARLKKNAN